jgi:hypothetical protein
MSCAGMREMVVGCDCTLGYSWVKECAVGDACHSHELVVGHRILCFDGFSRVHHKMLKTVHRLRTRIGSYQACSARSLVHFY